ncbi:ectonucleoside triphosphate diphosphohydrolase 1-like isoform X1 [Argiope bruennichi]|uniref:ectonucleoside triphosphate diphosphohydrolase 1-like isoform X1 n=2 Tax=Argiope bruennichi TaxID=94029 RepID=UPI002493F2FC|nr:ectonucleoside triphosphate diphosphohydrolase 1-like isoform X1 [Argiope bruennichi]
MHQRKGEYEPLLDEMLTVYVESSLASPLSGNVSIEVNPRSTVRDIINNFLFSLQRDDSSVPGLAIFDKHFNKLDWNASIESQGIEEGSKLYIGYDKSRIFRPFHIAVVGAATLVIAVILFIVSCVLFGATGGTVATDYGIVIDAGSTHTEVFLYYWSGNKDHGTGVVKQKDSCEYEEGIATGNDPENILKCVNNITNQIPSGLPSPRLYLGATGGMRLLNASDPKDANLILMTLKYALSTKPVQVETVDIIKGEDEALFSWISTNFLNQSLTQGQALDTYGALDLGGASTQYAYAEKKSADKNLSTGRDLNLFGHSYSVASESFLCFGYYEAMDRSEAIAMMKNGSEKLFDPCLPTGFSRTLNAKEFSEKPCVGNKNFTTWLQNNSDITQLTVTGSSNYNQCKKSVEYILDDDKCKDMGYVHCLNAPKLGRLNSRFMAFSGFYYVVHFLNASRSLEEFTNATKNWCNLTWDEIQKIAPKSQLHHVSRYCFAGIYIIELLTSKYGFDSSTWKNIDFKNEVGGADVGWTLGFMIYATNNIPEKTPSPPAISLAIFVPLLILSIIMAILSTFVLRNHIKRYYHYGHERLLHI